MRSSLVALALVLFAASPIRAQTPPEDALAIRVTPDERWARVRDASLLVADADHVCITPLEGLLP